MINMISKNYIVGRDILFPKAFFVPDILLLLRFEVIDKKPNKIFH